MRNIGFSYKGKVNIELSGSDLELLRTCARHHYDFLCKATFERCTEGFGNGWANQFQCAHKFYDSEHEVVLRENPSLTVEVTAEFCQLDRCLKILEQGKVLPIERWCEVQLLRAALGETLAAINDEFSRLNPL